MNAHTYGAEQSIQSRARLALGASSMASFYRPTEGERGMERKREKERGGRERE